MNPNYCKDDATSSLTAKMHCVVKLLTDLNLRNLHEQSVRAGMAWVLACHYPAYPAEGPTYWSVYYSCQDQTRVLCRKNIVREMYDYSISIIILLRT